MEKLILSLAINFLMLNFCFAQEFESDDFFELGFRKSSFIESTFLETSDFQGVLSDPNIESVGFLASPTGKNYSLKFRYGKMILPNCLLYTSPSPRDQRGSRMPSSA